MSKKSAYDAYLRSFEWQVVKSQWRNDPDRLHACAHCGARRYELHHTSYLRLGHPGEIDDLMPLCRDCHQVEHGL